MTIPKWLSAVIGLYGAFLILAALGAFLATRIVALSQTITPEMLGRTYNTAWVHLALGTLTVISSIAMLAGRRWAAGLWIAVAFALMFMRVIWTLEYPNNWVDFAIDTVVLGGSAALIIPIWRRSRAL